MKGEVENAKRRRRMRRKRRKVYARLTQWTERGRRMFSTSGPAINLCAEKEEEESLFIANAVNEEDSERDRATSTCCRRRYPMYYVPEGDSPL